MKKTLLTILLCAGALSVSVLAAEKADWYLYVWAQDGPQGDLGQFETTEEANIFVIPSCEVTVQGIGFCVRNGSWSSQYGWDSESVSTTGTDVRLATSTQANGWLALPAGTYKVTWNSTALTIRFDTPDEEEPGEPEEPESKTGKFLRGGDLSMVTYLEDWGTVYKYKDGTAGDVFEILEKYGVNLARLRLYNTPGTAVKSGGTTYRTPVKSPRNNWQGYAYAGPDDVLELAKRAKAHHMQICLSIYLSDYWAGATEQYIPQAWKNVTSNDVLADSVYNYVYAYMQRLAAEDIYPEYVSVGNETNYGILYTNLNGTKVGFGGHTDNISQCVKLFNKAYDAIKAVSPESKVIIHHSYGDAGKIGVCRNFFKNLQNNGCKFDIVGGSYYPHWSQNHGASDDTPTGMLTWARDMETNIGKPVMLMEVGYSWTQYRPNEKNGGNYEGQLHMNGSYNEASEAGQEAFIKSLHEALESDENILGYMYWDPVFVDQKVSGSWTEVCWAEKYDSGYDTWWQDGNIISNTTLFDYNGMPLSALWRETGAYYQPGTTTGNPSREIPSKEGVKILRDGQLYLMYKGAMYNVQGWRIIEN